MANGDEESTKYRARYALSGGEVVERPVVAVADGRIRSIEARAGATPETRDLGDVALVPGRVNAHSHAFQRAIRGRTEYLDGDRLEDDFWSWREQMYGVALAVDPDQVVQIARQAFAEMLRAGITQVGEFHYLHNDPEGEPYDDPHELARRVIRAARDVGIRISVLRAAYARAGYDQETNPRQRRFCEPDVDTYLDRVDELRSDVTDRHGVSIGLAPHSIRAVPKAWFEPIRRYAESFDLPVHIHAAEQPGELEESRAEYGRTPIEALDEFGLLAERTTVVHATHATEAELDRMAETGTGVCACPTTERNLGDGFLPARSVVARDIPMSLGSDSHADIDPWTEMRLVEYHERLRSGRRNVLAAHGEARPDGSRQTASVLWPMGGEAGARALGERLAELRPGDPADFTAVDLRHPSIAGVDGPSLLPHLAFAMRPGAVRDVFVGGRPVVKGGEVTAADGERIRRDFVDVLRELET